jgi:hypothetical protein
MRAILLAATGLLALALLAPGSSAVWQPPPICPACTVLVAIASQCAGAVADQELNGGPGCAIVNQEEGCVVDEADQDAFNDGVGCAYVNSQQSSLECRVRQAEALLGLAQPC